MATQGQVCNPPVAMAADPDPYPVTLAPYPQPAEPAEPLVVLEDGVEGVDTIEEVCGCVGKWGCGACVGRVRGGRVNHGG